MDDVVAEEHNGQEQSTARAETARRRADTYRLLADVFNAEPTAEVLDALRRPESVESFEALGATFAEELDRMESELGKDRLVEELQCEFTRVFLGPGKHVGPYESLHRKDQVPGHWGPSTAKVKLFIEHHGFSYDESFQGMPDHISVEFQFLAELATAEADAVERGDVAQADQAREIQRVFHQEHVASWVPSFCDKVVELADLEFFKDFAQMTKAVVQFDTEELSPGEES